MNAEKLHDEKVYDYEFVRIYSILKQHEKYIPLRTFYF